MSFELKTDDEILDELGRLVNLNRRLQGKSMQDIEDKGGIAQSKLSNFVNGKSGGITLLNFIRMLRGIDKLDSLEKILEVKSLYSPSKELEQELPQKIYKKERKEQPFAFDGPVFDDKVKNRSKE